MQNIFCLLLSCINVLMRQNVPDIRGKIKRQQKPKQRQLVTRTFLFPYRAISRIDMKAFTSICCSPHLIEFIAKLHFSRTNSSSYIETANPMIMSACWCIHGYRFFSIVICAVYPSQLFGPDFVDFSLLIHSSLWKHEFCSFFSNFLFSRC